MSARRALVLLLAIPALSFLVACGGGGGSRVVVTPPPSGGFSNSNLNGTYVFSVSGTDSTGASYAMVGTFAANGSGGNGKGGITGGTLDITDANTGEFTGGPIASATINSNSFYSVSVDGRGQATIGTNIQGFGNITLDFVLSSSSHGLVSEFDTFGTGSGTLDLQTASVTPTGPYAFSLAGAFYGGTTAFATVGNFTVGSGGAIAGLEDFNDGGAAAYTSETLTGTVVAGPTSTPSTTLTTPQFATLTFDVFPIDANHLKFIEMDTTATLSGDAFSQTSTTIPAGTYAFTLQGTYPALSGTPFAAGGLMTTDGTSSITSASTEDFNEGGTLSPATSPSFTATYGSATGQTGRYTFTNFSGFTPSNAGFALAAYPSSGGIFLLEIDNAGITIGAAYAQSPSASFSTSAGYGLNLSGVNLGQQSGQPSEVDDIAEFTPGSGSTINGLIDENSLVTGPIFASPFINNSSASSTYTAPVNGRGSIAANVSGTVNGGFILNFYSVDGTTYPFMEYDNGQVATGVFVAQSTPATSAARETHSMFMPQPLFRPHSAKLKRK
jgi:hypothetical protein